MSVLLFRMNTFILRFHWESLRVQDLAHSYLCIHYNSFIFSLILKSQINFYTSRDLLVCTVTFLQYDPILHNLHFSPVPKWIQFKVLYPQMDHGNIWCLFLIQALGSEQSPYLYTVPLKRIY